MGIFVAVLVCVGLTENVDEEVRNMELETVPVCVNAMCAALDGVGEVEGVIDGVIDGVREDVYPFGGACIVVVSVWVV